MQLKWVGAILVIAGGAGFGLSMCRSIRMEINALSRLADVLGVLRSELSCRMTTLPDAFRRISQQTDGLIGDVFYALAEELEKQQSPDAGSCMQAVLSRNWDIPPRVRVHLQELSRTLGRFDLDEQLHHLVSIEESCRTELESLNKQKEDRIRRCQTLGLCAGAALAILMI